MAAPRSESDSDALLCDDDLATWKQIKATVLADLPNATEFVGERSRVMDDEALRFQVSMFPTGISLSVPYWSEGDEADGDEADAIVRMLRRLTGQVEQITGLVGYDPQSDCPFLEGQRRQALDAFDQVRVLLNEDAATTTPEPPSDASPAPKRRWWQRGRN